MKIKKQLKQSNICIDLKAKDKAGVIAELLNVITDTGNVKHPEQALDALLLREEKMSTGMELGIAIPHARTDSVTKLQVAIGVHHNGVEFQALDGELSHIFIMTLSPVGRAGPHIQFLAALSGIFSDPVKRQDILCATTAAEALHVLLEK